MAIVTMSAFHDRSRSLPDRRALHRSFPGSPRGSLAARIAKGELHAPIDRHFTLDEIVQAAKHSWAGARKGKVMLAPNGV